MNLAACVQFGAGGNLTFWGKPVAEELRRGGRNWTKKIENMLEKLLQKAGAAGIISVDFALFLRTVYINLSEARTKAELIRISERAVPLWDVACARKPRRRRRLQRTDLAFTPKHMRRKHI